MTETKSVTVDYFAIFREVCGQDRETVSTRAATLAELYEELKAHHHFPLPLETLRAAVDDEFAPWGREVQDGDRVAFLAPVAGG
jgi:molybdopterin converting factor small subunit